MSNGHWSRPPPRRAKATLKYPKAVLFSIEDLAMIEALRTSTGEDVSIGHIVRNAIRKDYGRLVRRRTAIKAYRATQK